MYDWICPACAVRNDASIDSCHRCGCPARSTIAQHEHYRAAIVLGSKLPATEPPLSPATPLKAFVVRLGRITLSQWMLTLAAVALVGFIHAWGTWENFGIVAGLSAFTAYFTWSYVQKSDYVSLGSSSLSAKNGSDTRSLVLVLTIFLWIALVGRVIFEVWYPRQL